MRHSEHLMWKAGCDTYIAVTHRYSTPKSHPRNPSSGKLTNLPVDYMVLHAWRRPFGLLIINCWLCWHVCDGKALSNPDFNGEPPARSRLETDEPEVRDALRYVMTELKRLSNQYRYASLIACHGAAAGPANFDGRNIFLDVEFDMLRGQPSRHDIIVFKDEALVITGMAIDEFPEVQLRGQRDPDV